MFAIRDPDDVAAAGPGVTGYACDYRSASSLVLMDLRSPVGPGGRSVAALRGADSDTARRAKVRCSGIQGRELQVLSFETMIRVRL